MKPTFSLLFIIIIMLSTKILSQETLVKDVTFKATESGVEIYYSLFGEADEEYEIRLYLKREKIPSFEYEPKHAAGDIGKGKFVGIDRKIFWEILKEFPNGSDATDYYFEVTSEKLGGGIPWYGYVGGALILGGASLLIKSPPASSNGSASFASPPGRP